MFGFLNLDKPSGPTSHDIVAAVRRRLGVRQVGHAGTLDPLATGVLVVGVGPATRLLSFFSETGKEYVARLLLGRTTDTEDITGETLSEASAAAVTAAQLEAAAASLRGPILQTPPMVSAVKHQGKRLYELARKGETVERKPRPVTIYSLEISDFCPGEAAEATLAVRCSGGVYIRTLCADLGQTLGCGGCMAALRRTAVGPFRAETALSMEQFHEKGPEALLPPEAALPDLPAVCLDPEQLEMVRHGGAIEVTTAFIGASRVRLHDAGGALVAVARTLESENRATRLQPYIVFA